MRASVDMVISAPIEEVWTFVSDLENMDKWVTGITEPQLTSEGEVRAGSTFTSQYTYRGKTFDMAYLVTEFSSLSRLAIESTSGPFPFEGIVDLRPTAGGTKVTSTIEAGADSVVTSLIFVLFGPLVRVMMRRQLLRELNTLKTILEAR